MLIYGHGNEEVGNIINTRESFPKTRATGVEGVELDVRLAADGGLVVFHDHIYADGREVAATATSERPADVILLDEALDLSRGLIVNIEIKNFPQDAAFDPSERIIDSVVELLESREWADHGLISSFGIAAIDRAKLLQPQFAVAHLVLSRRTPADVVRTCVDHGHSIIHPYMSMVDQAFMDVARSRELTVNAWTGPDETDQTIIDLIDLGVDGLITANPARAVAVRARRKADAQ